MRRALGVSKERPTWLSLFCKVLDDAEERSRLYRLAHNGYGAGFLGSLSNVAVSRHYHDRNVGKPRIFASLGKKTPAIEYRHLQVQKNHGGTSVRVGKQLKRLTSIRRASYRVPL